MSGHRRLPWTDIVAAVGQGRFEEIRAGLAESGRDPMDRDAFLLERAVAAVLRDLVPGDAVAAAVPAYGALLHALYNMWLNDWPSSAVTEDALRAAAAAPRPVAARKGPPTVRYLQFPEHLVWGQELFPGPYEPVDGLFVMAWPAVIRAIAVLGFRYGRDGYTTMEASLDLPAPAPGRRDDGSAPFSTVIPGVIRDAARKLMLSVLYDEELAALAAYALEAADASLAPPGARG